MPSIQSLGSTCSVKYMRKLPGLSSWVECCYSTDSHLLFGDHSLLSCCGSNRGIPSPPYVLQSLFSQLLRELRGKCLICSAVPGTWTMAHCVALQDLNLALRIMEEEGPLRGLCLNHRKSFPYISPGDDICNTLPF